MDFKAIAKRAEAKAVQPTTGGAMDFKAIADRANSAVDVDANAVTDWYNGNVNIAKRLDSYSKEERWGNPDADLQAAIEAQKQKALDVQRYINVNRDQLADYDSLVREYDNYVGFLRDAENYVKNQNAVYSAYANRDAYDNAVRIGKLQGMSADELKQYRKEETERVNAEIAALQKELDAIPTWTRTGHVDEAPSYHNAEDEARAQELKSQISKLESRLGDILYVNESGNNVTYDTLLASKESADNVKKYITSSKDTEQWDKAVDMARKAENHIGKNIGEIARNGDEYEALSYDDQLLYTIMSYLGNAFPDTVSGSGDLARFLERDELNTITYLLLQLVNEREDKQKMLDEYREQYNMLNAAKGGISPAEYDAQLQRYNEAVERADDMSLSELQQMLYGTYGPTQDSWRLKLDKFSANLAPVLELRRMDEHNEWWQDYTDEQPFWAWVAARGANFLSMIETVGDTAKFLTTGESDRNMFASTADTIDAQNVQNIKANLGEWGDFVGTLYGVGSSLGDMALTLPLASINPTLAAAAMGTEAAAHAKNAALDRGMEGWQAELTGLAAGVAETVFENIPIGQIKEMKKAGVSGLRDLAMNIAESMVTNASEEFLTELANGIYDILANGDFSQFETDMRMYMQQGMTEAEARQKAAENFGIQLGESALSGMLMGLPFGAGASFSSWHASSALGKTVNDVDFLVELGKQFEGTRAHELALEVESGNTKDAKLGSLLSEITAEMENAGEDVSNKAVDAAKQNLEQIANGIAAQVPDNNVGNITDADVTEATEHLGFEASSEDIAAADVSIDADEKALDEMESASAPQGYVAPNSSKQVKRYQTAWARNASRALSRNVYFYDGADHDGTESGFVGEDGAIYINTKSPATRNSVAIVLGHEYVHTVEGTGEYNELAKAIFESAVFQKSLSNFQNEDGSIGTTLDGMIAAIQKQYAAAGRQLSAEAVKTEIVAQFVAERILQDGRTLAQFAKTGWFAQFLVRLRRLLARLASKDVDKAEIVKLERLLQRAVRAAKQNPAATKVGRGKNSIISEQKHPTEDGEVQHSLEDLDYDKPITMKDVIWLRTIGRKSVNDFTAEDIEKAAKWAYKFYKELGVKSPFFRAWFGDWRAYDRKQSLIVKSTNGDIANSGKSHNIDMDRAVSWNRQLIGETINHAVKDKVSVAALRDIKNIVENAVLLNTEISLKNSGSKHPLTAFMHNCYVLYEYNGNCYLLKVYIEEALSKKGDAIFSKAYEFKDIKKVTELPISVLSKNGGLTEGSSITTYSISDLFALVKQYDPEFKPNPVHEEMIDFETGKPKLFYHQTAADFTEFDTRHEGAGTRDNETPFGIFLKTTDVDIGLKGEKQMPLYATMSNPLVVNNRAELTRILRKMSSEYDELMVRSKQIDDEYKRKADAADRAWNDYAQQETRKGRTRQEVYADPELARLEQMEDAVLEEWQKVQSENDKKCKEAIVKALVSAKYDGVILRNDQGSFGRSTDAYIVLNNTQVKSAVDPFDTTSATPPNIGTFSKYEGDIQYSIPFGFSFNPNAKAPVQTNLKSQSVDAQAKRLMELADAKGDRAEFTDLLRGYYDYMASGHEMTWEGVRDAAAPAVEWLSSHYAGLSTIDEHAREALKETRAVKVRMSADQKAEAAAMYGTYGAYHRKALGTMVFANDAKITLEERWGELADLYPEYFDASVKALDMPSKLLDVADELRHTNTAAMEREENMTQVLQDIEGMVHDSYWQVEEVRSEKERYEDRVYDLKKKHRAEIRDERAAKDRAVEEERERGDVRVKKERARAKEIEQRERAWQRVQRERDADRRRRTELKDKIRKKVNKLNTQLLNGTKEKNVKLGLREAVAYALNAVEIIDGEDYDRNLQRRIDYLDQQMYEAVSQEDIAAFQKQRDDLVARGDRMKERLEKLSAAYSAILADNDSQMQMYKHDAEMVRNRVDAVVEIVGETPLRYMNTRQLEAVLDMYTLVQTTIDNANKIFKQGKAEDLKSNATEIMDELSDFSNAEIDGYTETPELKEIIRGFSWNELKPVYAFRRLGSERFMELYQEMRRGEDVVARDVQDASAFARSLREKYGWDSWDLEKTYKFKTIDGRTLPLTVPQMMSLYAYSKRPQAQKHLEKGGIMFSDREMYKAERGIFDVKRSSRESWKIDPILINTIAKTLTPEQIHYVNAMQSYLSTTMGEKGNEVARVMWGIDIFKEKNYFPLKSSHDFVFSQSTANPLVSLKSSGMTKQTTPHAANPIILEGFDTVWAEHVVQMSNYHGFVIPIDNMNKVLNYADFINAEHAESVTTVIRSVFGDSAVKYIEKLIQDVNGGVKAESSVAFFPQLIGKAKKTAVAFSMSTVVQQPTAILRAMAMIAPKYFVGKYDMRKHSTKWEELKSYAPVAILKEIGGFDTTSSRGMVEWLNQKSYKGVAKVGGFLTDSYYRDDKLMVAAAKADEIGWVTIWGAVKREQAKLTKMDTASEAFLKHCGDRFTEVIQYTQVYDSTLSRSGLMRSKSEYMKMATAFMGEPTTSFNMLFDALIDVKRGASKLHAGRVIGSVYISTVFAAIAASAVYALRDDDEDEAYLDKWAEQFGKKLSSELWVHNMIPFVRDVASIFDGWDVERMDMAVIGDLVNAWNSIDNPNKHWWRKLEDLAGAIGALFGVPAKNMLRTGRELFNAVRFAVDDVAPGNQWEHFAAGFTRTDVLSELEKLNAAIAGEVSGTPYADNPTFAALEDLYDAALKEIEEIENDDTLTEAEKLKEKAEVNPNGVLIKPTVGSSWALEDGSLLSNNEEIENDVLSQLETLLKLSAAGAVQSEKYQTSDTAGRVQLVEGAYADIKAFVKGTLASERVDNALDDIRDLIGMLEKNQRMREPGVVDALSRFTLKDGAPLGSNETLAKGYPSAYEKMLERVKRENGNRFEYTKDGEDYVINLNRASDEELEVYEEKMEAKARSMLKKIYAAYDPDELEKLLKSTDPYTLYKRIK